MRLPGAGSAAQREEGKSRAPDPALNGEAEYRLKKQRIAQ